MVNVTFQTNEKVTSLQTLQLFTLRQKGFEEYQYKMNEKKK